MTTWILKDETIERCFQNFNFFWRIAKVFFIFFFNQNVWQISTALPQFIYFIKSECECAYIFFCFLFNNLHIAITQGFVLCIPTSHSEPLVIIVTVQLVTQGSDYFKMAL